MLVFFSVDYLVSLCSFLISDLRTGCGWGLDLLEVGVLGSPDRRWGYMYDV
jgi:hypothetical protein